jgi:hypothetical protein
MKYLLSQDELRQAVINYMIDMGYFKDDKKKTTDISFVVDVRGEAIDDVTIGDVTAEVGVQK